MQMLKIIKCSDGMRWYASKVGELVPYLGDSMGAYVSREDAGYLNFVQYEDAELMPDLTQLEQLQQNVADAKPAADAVYAYDTYDACKDACARYDTYNVNLKGNAPYRINVAIAYVKAKRELSNYLKEQQDNE